MNLEIVKNGKVTAKEVALLRKVIGWRPFTEKFDEALQCSYMHFSVRDGNHLIGFVRVISDGVIHAFIADLVVHPDYQRQGVGKALIKETVKALKQEKISFIELTFDEKLKSFYKECGFEVIRAGIIRKY